tara:strand:+ start:355 stop:696 length:342 start_codon:yes stop_codon:yes gene_type:complete
MAEERVKSVMYLREAMMLAIIALVSWTLMKTTTTSENVAVLTADVHYMKDNITDIQAQVRQALRYRYTKQDAKADLDRLMELIMSKTSKRYTSDDAAKDKEIVEQMIRNHRHE